MHRVYEWVLCQVVEIERTEKDVAKCVVIGYKDEKGRIKPIRIPFDHDAEVIKAEDEFIKSVIQLEDSEKGAYIGKIEGKEIEVMLDLKKHQMVCVARRRKLEFARQGLVIFLGNKPATQFPVGAA